MNNPPHVSTVITYKGDYITVADAVPSGQYNISDIERLKGVSQFKL